MSTSTSESSTATEQRDSRREALQAWVSGVLKSDVAISVASADASFRRYFRATLNQGAAGAQTWIVMDAPPEKEDVRPFIAVTQMLLAAGVNSPQVLEQNLAEGYLLLSDLGNRTYLAELQDVDRAEYLYGDAINALVQMQRSSHASSLPPYDRALLLREVELFPEWFLGKHLGLNVDASMRTVLNAAFEFLIQSALEQPRVFVHRDYHSRNLMVTGSAQFGRNPGVLDFQDAVFGPVTYDLVSLLRDCYISWPKERVETWMQDYLRRATHTGILQDVSFAQLTRWFDLMGIQRHLKAIGIFARLWHRDGKRGYLNDIPRTLGYIRTVAPNYPQLKPFVELIEQRIAPAVFK